MKCNDNTRSGRVSECVADWFESKHEQ